MLSYISCPWTILCKGFFSCKMTLRWGWGPAPQVRRALWLVCSNTAAHKHRAAVNMRSPITEVPDQEFHKEIAWRSQHITALTLRFRTRHPSLLLVSVRLMFCCIEGSWSDSFPPVLKFPPVSLQKSMREPRGGCWKKMLLTSKVHCSFKSYYM